MASSADCWAVESGWSMPQRLIIVQLSPNIAHILPINNCHI